MNYWKKTFLDGTSVREEEQRSWRLSRDYGINSVELQDSDILNYPVKLHIIGLGDYWQSDDMIVTLGEKKITRVARRIMKLIEPSEYFCELKVEADSITANFINPKQSFMSLQQGKWLVLEVNRKGLRHYVSLSK